MGMSENEIFEFTKVKKTSGKKYSEIISELHILGEESWNEQSLSKFMVKNGFREKPFAPRNRKSKSDLSEQGQQIVDSIVQAGKDFTGVEYSEEIDETTDLNITKDDVIYFVTESKLEKNVKLKLLEILL